MHTWIKARRAPVVKTGVFLCGVTTVTLRGVKSGTAPTVETKSYFREGRKKAVGAGFRSSHRSLFDSGSDTRQGFPCGALRAALTGARFGFLRGAGDGRVRLASCDVFRADGLPALLTRDLRRAGWRRAEAFAAKKMNLADVNFPRSRNSETRKQIRKSPGFEGPRNSPAVFPENLSETLPTRSLMHRFPASQSPVFATAQDFPSARCARSCPPARFEIAEAGRGSEA